MRLPFAVDATHTPPLLGTTTVLVLKRQRKICAMPKMEPWFHYHNSELAPLSTFPSRSGATICLASHVSVGLQLHQKEQPMLDRIILCRKCHGQRTIACFVCRGAGMYSTAGITMGVCKECDGAGQHRCDACGGTGEVELANSEMASAR